MIRNIQLLADLFTISNFSDGRDISTAFTLLKSIGASYDTEGNIIKYTIIIRLKSKLSDIYTTRGFLHWHTHSQREEHRRNNVTYFNDPRDQKTTIIEPVKIETAIYDLGFLNLEIKIPIEHVFILENGNLHSFTAANHLRGETEHTALPCTTQKEAYHLFNDFVSNNFSEIKAKIRSHEWYLKVKYSNNDGSWIIEWQFRNQEVKKFDAPHGFFYFVYTIHHVTPTDVQMC